MLYRPTVFIKVERFVLTIIKGRLYYYFIIIIIIIIISYGQKPRFTERIFSFAIKMIQKLHKKLSDRRDSARRRLLCRLSSFKVISHWRPFDIN